MSDEHDLMQLEQEWMEAWKRRDMAVLERLLAPDYEFVLSTNPQRVFTRAEWLGRVNGYTCESFAFTAISARILEPYAVVRSKFKQKATVDGEDRSYEFFLVDLWRRTARTWQVVARHSAWPEPSDTSGARLGQRS